MVSNRHSLSKEQMDEQVEQVRIWKKFKQDPEALTLLRAQTDELSQNTE